MSHQLQILRMGREFESTRIAFHKLDEKTFGLPLHGLAKLFGIMDPQG